MNDNTIDQLQDLAFQQKGFSLLADVYREHMTEHKGEYNESEIDAMQYAITQIGITYSKQLKQITDDLK